MTVKQDALLISKFDFLCYFIVCKKNTPASRMFNCVAEIFVNT